MDETSAFAGLVTVLEMAILFLKICSCGQITKFLLKKSIENKHRKPPQISVTKKSQISDLSH